MHLTNKFHSHSHTYTHEVSSCQMSFTLCLLSILATLHCVAGEVKEILYLGTTAATPPNPIVGDTCKAYFTCFLIFLLLMLWFERIK